MAGENCLQPSRKRKHKADLRVPIGPESLTIVLYPSLDNASASIHRAETELRTAQLA